MSCRNPLVLNVGFLRTGDTLRLSLKALSTKTIRLTNSDNSFNLNLTALNTLVTLADKYKDIAVVVYSTLHNRKSVC